MAAGQTAITINPADVQPDLIHPDDVQVDGQQPTQHSAVGDVARGVWDRANPMRILQGFEDTLHAIRTQPLGVAKEIFLHPYMAAGRGLDAIKAGKHEEAAAHFNSMFAPPGTGIEEANTEMATPGLRATGLGHALGIGATAYAGGKLPELASGVKEAGSTALDILSHPKVIGAMRDAAIELGKEIPGVKTLIKTGKAFSAGKSVLDDIRGARASAEIPNGPPPLPEEAASPAAPPQLPESAHAEAPQSPPSVDDLLSTLRKKIYEKYPDIAPPPGKHLGELAHGSYPDRWDTGSNAPTIESTAPQPKAGAAAPSAALAGNPKALAAAKKLAASMGYSTGDVVEMKNGDKLRIKLVNPDGSFEY